MLRGFLKFHMFLFLRNDLDFPLFKCIILVSLRSYVVTFLDHSVSLVEKLIITSNFDYFACISNFEGDYFASSKIRILLHYLFSKSQIKCELLSIVSHKQKYLVYT